jgi:hypothetical protein
VAIHTLSFAPSALQKDGPRIPIEISAPQSYIKEESVLGFEFPPPFRITAVLDTAASLTVVNPEVIEKCKLRHTGFATVVSVEKKGRYRQHAAWIRFPGAPLRDFDDIPVVACRITQQPYACLIGRDILRNWLFTYDGSGTVTIEELY